MPKTIIIFGCTGQDGSYLSKSLLKQDFEVVGVSRFNEPNQENHKRLDIHEELEIVTKDICNQTQMIHLIETYAPTEIYNLAAQSSVGLSFKDPLSTFKSITDGTRNILEACRLTNFDGRIFFAGSSEIYGHTDQPANLETKINPQSPYALAKYQSMLLVDFYKKIYKVKGSTGILFNHESPLRDKRFVTQKIISGAIECKKDQKNKIKLGNLSISRDWGYAEEFAEAIQLINRLEKIGTQIVCTGELNSLEYFVEKTFQTLDLNWKNHIEIDKNLFRPSDIIQSYGDPKPILEDCGWKTKVNLEELIEKLITERLKYKNFQDR
tara:strand:- start:1457 stop:2428 length:972 start_codon:yes stop_codon:yes gene_type:complete